MKKLVVAGLVLAASMIVGAILSVTSSESRDLPSLTHTQDAKNSGATGTRLTPEEKQPVTLSVGSGGNPTPDLDLSLSQVGFGVEEKPATKHSVDVAYPSTGVSMWDPQLLTTDDSETAVGHCGFGLSFVDSKDIDDIQVPDRIERTQIVGKYYRGDGLGDNTTLTFNESGEFEIRTRGCVPHFRSSEGRWTLNGNRISLTLDRNDVRLNLTNIPRSSAFDVKSIELDVQSAPQILDVLRYKGELMLVDTEDKDRLGRVPSRVLCFMRQRQ